MNKIRYFKANKALTDYIRKAGFKHHYTNSREQYYTNKEGNQIRIDYKSGIITFLDSKGYSIEYSTVFTSSQIDNFAMKNN